METQFSPAAHHEPPPPLQTACAEGRHYTCGAKACSCDCHKTSKRQVRKGPAIVFVSLVAIAAIIWAILPSKEDHKSATKPSSPLSQPALELASYMFVDDLKAAFTDKGSVMDKAPEQEILAWTKLDLRTTAAEYEAAYDDNEISADNQYKGKRILVTGTVSRIQKDFSDEGNIWLRGSGLLGIHAVLDRTGTKAAASFTRGQRVSLVCTGAGQFLTVATLSACEPLESYLARISPEIDSKIKSFLEGHDQLWQKSAEIVTMAYVMGLTLPADSPCINGNREECLQEIDRLSKDQGSIRTMRAKAQSILTTLRVEK